MNLEALEQVEFTKCRDSKKRKHGMIQKKASEHLTGYCNSAGDVVGEKLASTKMNVVD